MHLTLFLLRIGEMLIIGLDIWSSVLPIIIIINPSLWEKQVCDPLSLSLSLSLSP